MRGLLLGLVFFSLVPLIFFKSPYVGVLLWYWVSLMSPQSIVWSSVFSHFNFALIAASLTLCCWLFSREPKLPPRTRTTLLILLVMSWLCVTTLHAIGPPDQVQMYFVMSEKMLLMTLLAYAWTTTRQRLDGLILVCVLSVTFFGLKGGVWTLLTGGSNRVYGPEGSNIADNNDLGVALTMFLPLVFYLQQRYRQPLLKWPFIALIGFTVIGDLFTYSRGAFVALCAMSLILWSRSRKKLATGFAIIVLAVFVWNFAPASLFERFDTIETYKKDASAEDRLYVWKLSWQLALKYPILGCGLRCMHDKATVNRELANSGLPPLTQPRAAHSIWFQMLGEQGFPGLAIFVLLLLSGLRDARWLLRNGRGHPNLRWAEDLGRTAQASIVGFAVGGTFASLAFYDGFYAILIIIASARVIAAAEIQLATCSGASTEASAGRALIAAPG